ncbi:MULTISPECIES: flavodoxin family protein [unclassified Methanoregula]|uniref:flavodoxin family protein n=1 Tax=unclassified Methanoregula TaxID=2649730 RepID=UPI0009CFB70D|nr:MULTISPECIES: flavodoxin family protein [unclassified Methanoregula]OPX64308.1 MAG: Iron-sulfur flavoprotein [Methanoregula sp. PtaB.Bin085]OPY33567.1 MAG: Iron-sulfur flavoprotein [Methanoregula sp. PtaU1.Bin006]
MTKVLAINGSPRKDGNTSVLIRTILAEMEKKGIETETIQIGGKKVHGCLACMKCFENRDGKCVIDDDIVNLCIRKMREADGIILGSPVYFLDITAEMKALIDRAGFVSYANGHPLKHKVGNVTVAVRRAGASRTADSMLHFLLANDMIVPGLPVIGIGRDIGDVEKDEEGMDRARHLGKTMAQLLKHFIRHPLPA